MQTNPILVYTIFVIVAAGVAIVSALAAIKSYFWKQALHDMYIVVDYFVRNLHKQSFYHPIKHPDFSDYLSVYYQLKKIRSKWYFSEGKREKITRFLYAYDDANAFVTAVAKNMDEEHYFSHSEYLSCRDLAKFEGLREFIDENFLVYVNNHVPSSLLSTSDYLKELDANISDIPQKHNLVFVKKELERNKEFFDTVMKYPLDQQQRESIVKLEDNALVISSAGSGKTSTTVGKIKYLVERMGVPPHKILPLTFAKKAADELAERLNYSDKGMRCHTFHSLAFSIVDKVTHKKPDVCDAGLMLQCFYHQARVNPDFKEAINEFLTKRASLTKGEHEYESGEEYLRDRALYGVQAPFLDMNGKIIFTRSEEEKKICTFLTMNGIDFLYEEPYPYDTATTEKRQYKPDFTIYYTRDGVRYYLILEHFGIDKNGHVPVWFGDGKDGGYPRANDEYNAGIDWKRRINKKYKTSLLETTSAMFHDGTIYEKLTAQLQYYGVPMRPLSEEEKFDKLVVRNKRMEDSLLQLISTFVTLMKSNRNTFEDIFEVIKKANPNNKPFVDRSEFMIYRIFKPVYEDYQATLKEKKQVDFTDLILMATDISNEGKYHEEYDYILVDEFQDISVDRFKLLQAIRRKEPLTKLYGVGDDWQSIFRFTGSDLTLFSDFEEYFGFTEKCRIETTYRFGNPLVKMSSAFILKNDKQVPKEIKPYKATIKTEFSVHEYNDEKDNTQWNVVKDIVNSLPENESVMLIARYHADSDFIPASNIASKDDKHHVTEVKIGNRTMPFNTVHSAKGLEADHVILVNCSQDGNGFPSKVSDDPILGYVLSQPETYPFAEERRLFYVAITRAKKHSYVLYKESCPSPFIADMFAVDDASAVHDHNSMLCPMCKNGILRAMKTGETQFSKWAFYACTNRTAACPYTWFVNYVNESEILSQYRAISTVQGNSGVANNVNN